jgi:two-component system, cell cycle sensor histidine kinase and response regulator CckA
MNNPQNLLPPRSDQKVILIAEDEVTVQNVARIVLETAGYFILTASDGDEALTLSRTFPGNIDVLLTDFKMPKLNGVELTRQILTERPAIRVLMMSGHVDDPLIEGMAFLAKPFGPPVLRERIRQLLMVPA